MTKTRVYLKDFLYSLYYFVLIYCIVVFVTHIVLRIDRFYEPLLMIIPFIIGFFISMETRHFSVFIGLNLLLMFSFLLIPMNFPFKVQTMIFAFLMTLFWIIDRIYSNPMVRNADYLPSFAPQNTMSPLFFKDHGVNTKNVKNIAYKKNTDDKGNGNARTLSLNNVIGGYALILALELLGGPIFATQEGFTMTDTVKNVYVPIAIAIFIIAIMQMHMSNLTFSLSMAVSTNIVSVKKITRFNNGVIIGFTAIAGVIVALATRLNAENILIYLGNLLRGGVMFIADSLGGVEKSASTSNVTIPWSGGNSLPLQSGDTFFLWKIFDNIIAPVALIAIIVVILLIICFSVYSVYKKFYMEKPGEDIKEFIKPDISFNRIHLFSFLSTISKTWSSDNNGKIRKLFYKKIASHIKNGIHIKDASTPQEIADILKKREDISALATVYSKARYSNEIVSDTDAEQMRCGYR